MLPAFAIEHVQASTDRGEIRLRGILGFAEAALSLFTKEQYLTVKLAGH